MKSQNQQSQIQPTTESKLISVYKLIDRPKQLIEKQTINKLYPQIWESHSIDSIDQDKTITINHNNSDNHRLFSQGLSASFILRSQLGKKQGRCSTEMQIRNTIKSTGRSRNTRYNNQDSKSSLVEMERIGQFGKLVYQRVAGRINWNWVLKTENYFSIYQNYQPDNQISHGLIFDSKFESGNLWKVYKSLNSNSNNPQTYSLITQNDTNTFGYNQWFYFRVKSDKPFETVRFQIINMRKSYSSFNRGMKIAILSEKKWKEQRIGWHRGATNIEYTSNQIKGIKNDNESLCTLGWDYSFETANEWVYFAYSYPYTYTQLKMLMSKTKKFKSEAQWIELCLSCLKNQMHMLNINKTYEQNQRRQKQLSVELKNNKKERTASKKILTSSIQDQLFLQEKKQKSFCNPLIKKNRNRSRYLNLNLNLNANIKNRGCERVQNMSPKMKSNSILNFPQNPSKQLQSKNETIQNVQFQLKQQQNATKKVNLNKFLREFKNNSYKLSKEQNSNKEILIIMARAHPGQTPSSFVAEGVINSLLKQNQNEFKFLKQKLNIFIIPMLNPDGVIHGNTRTSLSGNDLNRRWLHPNKILHPQIYYIKEYFKDLISKGHKIFAMVDLHAHTRKQSSFFYGCCDKKNYSNHADTKLLNILMAKIQNNFNSLYSSHFVGESKKSTARITFYREFKCLSYTLQSSFLGESQSSLHFSVKDYYNIGRNLLKSLAYLYSSVKWSKIQSLKGTKMINQPLLNNMQLKQTILQHFERYKRQEREQNKRKYKQEDEQKQSQGSSSAPSRDNYKQQFVLRNFFQGGKQVRVETRYRARSFNKVGKRNMSLSISDKPSLSQLQECGERKKNMTRDNMMRPKLSIKAKKIQIQSKQDRLPLINFQLKQEQPLYQFHAFNFKSKKGGRKKLSEIAIDSTIN